MNRSDVIGPMIGSRASIWPSMLRVTRRATRSGKAMKMSVTRISTSSNQPPRIPANAPTAVPMTTAMSAAASPTPSETRVP